jgi:hypothetical protein
MANQDQKQLRAMLRKLLKNGQLQYRRTYHDYYDSCHAPSETPNAPWEDVSAEITENGHNMLFTSLVRDLKAGGPLVKELPDGYTYELWTSYHRYELRLNEELIASETPVSQGGAR